MMVVTPYVAAVGLEYAATGDLGKTGEHPVTGAYEWSPSVSAEGTALFERFSRVERSIGAGRAVMASPGAAISIRFASAAPTSWIGFAQALFATSRTMTRDERNAYDQSAWADLEPLDFVDD